MAVISETQSAVLSLVSSALFGKPVVLPPEPDWRAIAVEAKQQAVLSLIFPVARAYLPAEALAAWERESDRIVAGNIRLAYEHSVLHRLMSEGGIAYTVMKGPVSAAYYPEPMLRTMGDVDFLIDPSDVPRAKALLKEAGFSYVKSGKNQHHLSYRRVSEGGPVWEMHWEPNGVPEGPAGAILRDYLADMVECAAPKSMPGGVYRVPSVFHQGLVTLLHVATHLINEGIGVRHLCDWAVFVARQPEDVFLETFRERLTAAGLWRFAQILTRLSAEYLGSPAYSWAGEVPGELLAPMMADILAGGNFGQKDAQRYNQAKLMTDHGKGSVDGTGFFRQLCRTLSDRAREAMPVLRRCPVLMPLGWIYVGARHILRILAGRRPKLHLGETVHGAAARREIYRQLHLFEME